MSDTAQSMVSRPQWAGGPAKSSPVRRRGENLLPVQPVKQRQPLHQQVFIPSERVPAQGRGPAGKPAGQNQMGRLAQLLFKAGGHPVDQGGGAADRAAQDALGGVGADGLPGRFRLPFCDDSNSCINAM